MRRRHLILLLTAAILGLLLRPLLKQILKPPAHSTERRVPDTRVTVHRAEPPPPLPIPPHPALGNAAPGWHAFSPPPKNTFKPFELSQERTPGQILPCAEDWVAHGIPCPAPPTRLDVVWTWVNGSDALLEGIKDDVARAAEAAMNVNRGRMNRIPFYGVTTMHFRDHGEMRYSMRSVLKNIPHEIAGKYTILTADVKADDTDELRLGSIPTWLNLDAGVRVLHHSDVFRGSFERDAIVPSFNSLAIESQLSNLQDSAQTIFYMNDDCFVLRQLSGADFQTPLYGPVFRIQFDLAVESKRPGSMQIGMEGEWPALEYTNWLLDQRFGPHRRRYLHHVSKVLSTPILHEVANIWADELGNAAKARFRGQGLQVNLIYLVTWYTIEMHRETLLYSFIMLHVDADGDGQLSEEERAILTAGLDASGVTRIPAGDRSSKNAEFVAQNLEAAGLESPRETEYIWLAVDGYPLVYRDHEEHRTRPKANGPPSKGANQDSFCTIKEDLCFPAGKSAREMLKRVAVEEPRCGDCLILHVLRSSPSQGLDSFLPKTRGLPRRGMHLNQGKSWDQVEFPSGLGREHIVNLLQRYHYAIGDSPIAFISMLRPDDMRKLPTKASPTAFLAINDDLKNPGSVAAADQRLEVWYKLRFGASKGRWEKDESRDEDEDDW